MRSATRAAGAAVLGLLATLATSVALASPAGAHAVLESTDPADRSRVDTAPADVVFEFSEPVSAATGAVRVYDADGDRVDDGSVETSGGTVTVGLEDGLGDSGYVATYRVISADGHPISGAIAFTVGDGPAADDALLSSLFDDDADRPWEIVGAVLRWLGYGGALLAAGAALFVLLVDDDRRPGTARLIRLAAVVGAAGVLGHLLVQAQLASGLGLWSLFRDGVAGDVLADGVGATAAAVVAGLVLVAAGLAARGAVRRVLLGAGAGLATAGFALSGHTTTTDPEWLATGADVVHVVAAAAWFGGIVLLVGAVRRHRRDDDPTAAGQVVGRFSAVAAVAILGVSAAGIALGWAEVRSLDALTSTGYGRLLLVKVAVVAVAVAMGAYNRFRLVPAVAAATAERPGRTAWAILGRTVRVEAGVMVVALALTGVLVQVTPARATVTGPFSTTVPLGDGSVNVVVDPADVGSTELHLYLLDETGRPGEATADGLSLRLTLPAQDIGPLVREPYVAGPGHYQLDGEVFSVAGTWEVEIVARASRFETVTATAEVPIRR